MWVLRSSPWPPALWRSYSTMRLVDRRPLVAVVVVMRTRVRLWPKRASESLIPVERPQPSENGPDPRASSRAGTALSIHPQERQHRPGLLVRGDATRGLDASPDCPVVPGAYLVRCHRQSGWPRDVVGPLVGTQDRTHQGRLWHLPGGSLSPVGLVGSGHPIEGHACESVNQAPEAPAVRFHLRGPTLAHHRPTGLRINSTLANASDSVTPHGCSSRAFVPSPPPSLHPLWRIRDIRAGRASWPSFEGANRH